jgi:Zn-dependent M28 family amino/carboxypeptidase
LRILFSCIIFLILISSSTAQLIDSVINKEEVEKIEKVLSSDDMEGRRIFTRGIDKAADFISGKFDSSGLKSFGNYNGFKQQFFMISARLSAASAKFNNKLLPPENIAVVSGAKKLSITEKSGYEKRYIKPGDDFKKEVNADLESGKNLLVLVDSKFENEFQRFSSEQNQMIEPAKSVVFILTRSDPRKYEIKITQEIKRMNLANVLGILPGKSRKNEYVIFSAHYDHLGIDMAQGIDSIFNGSNDNAAGITAIIMLARYFKALGNNERTIVFAAFTAEEEGGYGSQYFSKHLDPAKVVSMFNIEMIGTESKWGENSAFITGYDHTNMGKIMEKNLEGTAFKFYPDPYPEQKLFFRSDNATLAKLGVPAHTISTSKMDNEKYYHTVDDEIETLDLSNMTRIIKAIALSARTIIEGTDTPSRVKAGLLE